MGPGGKSGKLSSFFDPPFFSAEGDLESWRKKVGQWADSLKVAHDEGTDRTFQTIFKLLGRTLYDRGLPDAQKAIVDEAQSKGLVDYLQMEDPVEAALQIVKLVAVDPPIAMVTRLISSYQKVTSCRRDRHEKLSTFVSRFRGLAAKHLLHANASSSSQIGEVLAITLLNNANLEEGTITNAKLQLISHAEALSTEDKKDADCTESVPKEVLLELKKLNDQLHSLDAPIRESDMSAAEFKKSLMDYRSKNVSIFRQLNRVVQHLKVDPKTFSVRKSVTDRFLSQNKSCRLNLDDAVIVLRHLTQTSSMDSPQFSMKDVQAMVDRKVKSFLKSHSNMERAPILSRLGNNDRIKPSSVGFQRPSERGVGNPSGRYRQKRSFGDSNAVNATCFDCGDTGHCRGDDCCKEPSAFTRKKKLRRIDGSSSRPGPGSSGSGFFRKGSGAGQSK